MSIRIETDRDLDEAARSLRAVRYGIAYEIRLARTRVRARGLDIITAEEGRDWKSANAYRHMMWAAEENLSQLRRLGRITRQDR